MTINLIWAQGRNREIGLNNGLPWSIPEDMAYFKRTTLGSVVIMGSKTFASLDKPLPGRINVVLSRNTAPKQYDENVWTYNSIPMLLNDLKGKKAFVIGGSEIYETFMRFADRLYVTHIDDEFEADAFAPLVDWASWNEIDKEVLAEGIVAKIYNKI